MNRKVLTHLLTPSIVKWVFCYSSNLTVSLLYSPCGWTLFGGNNFPLRGGKFSLFEGGTRVPAFVHSPLLRNTGLTYAGIIHAVDWFPTLLSAAGILPRESPSDLDGVDQWEAITAMSPSRRSEVVYNLDYHPLPIQGRAAIRVGEYKLITGYPGVFHDWYRPGAEDQGFPHSTVREMLRAPGLNQSQEQFEYLFNLQDDPTEQTNLYSTLPGIVRKLRARLRQHRRKYVTANFPANSVGSNPARYGGVWSPGCGQFSDSGYLRSRLFHASSSDRHWSGSNTITNTRFAQGSKSLIWVWARDSSSDDHTIRRARR
ncbi:hypothetical protein RRG08_004795 [Elysia crispata]|uniref:Sulfatase N-terminal domain-containing protein n=1 Tax=Elysia crispata TaxID=231223 RepID=A0AAE1CSS1_9GAST|nr:hypothetical protein RRG08_004795 [Elysia crispata]